MSKQRNLICMLCRLGLLTVTALSIYNALFGLSSLSPVSLSRANISALINRQSPSISKTPCDSADKKRIRASRPFDLHTVGDCIHPEYHTMYFDDIANTLIAACNVLESINATFVIVQGTLLSILRNQPVLPWDADADIYLVVNPEALQSVTSSSGNTVENNGNTVGSTFNDGYYDYFDLNYYSFYGIEDGLDALFERVQNATIHYRSNALDGQQRYKVLFNRNDAWNIFRFVKEEATNWGCTGYTDIYVIHVDPQRHVYDGGDAGNVAHQSVDLDFVFPVRYYREHWVPHWQSMEQWKGERFIGDTLPIPRRPHAFSELAYPDHMVSDNNESVWTCTLSRG